MSKRCPAVFDGDSQCDYDDGHSGYHVILNWWTKHQIGWCGRCGYMIEPINYCECGED